MRKPKQNEPIVITNIPETTNALVLGSGDMLRAEQSETYLSTKEYAKKHGISQTTVRSQIRRKKLEGRLKKCPCGNCWLVRDEEE